VIGLVPTDHLNPTHDEVVDVVKNSLMDAGITEDRIREAQGGPRNPQKCDTLIAIPGLKAHRRTGIGTVLQNYIMYSGSPSSYHKSNSSQLLKKRKVIRGEPWPLSPPLICVEAAGKVYGLGTSRMDQIQIQHYG
jgi:hypothetical protein